MNTNKIGRIGLIGLILLAVSCQLLVVPIANAIGVSVTPAELQIQAHAGQESVARIRVANPSKDVVLFEVYPDDLENLISVAPSSFTLESGEEKNVEARIKNLETGKFLTTLSIVGRLMADSKFQAGSGVKIPVTITVTSGQSGLASVFENVTSGPWLGIIALALLLGWGAYKLTVYRSRRAQSAPH